MEPNVKTQTSRCQEAQALLGSYALGMTTEEESALVEAALLDCPDLVGELADYNAITDTMLYDVRQTAPPATLRASILAAADAQPASQKRPTQKAKELTVIERWRRMILSPVGAAAALALIALIVTNSLWLSETQRLRTDNRQLYYDMGHLEEENAYLAGQVQGAQNLVRALGTDRGGRAHFATEAISQGDTTPSAELAWTIGATDDIWVVLFSVENLPALQDAVYQLWLRHEEDDSIISIGTFEVDEEGRGTIIFEIDEPVGSFASAGVTIEPPGGSPQPTGEVAIRGDI
jgi:anti-sigma-K factor RskA